MLKAVGEYESMVDSGDDLEIEVDKETLEVEWGSWEFSASLDNVATSSDDKTKVFRIVALAKDNKDRIVNLDLHFGEDGNRLAMTVHTRFAVREDSNRLLHWIADSMNSVLASDMERKN